MRGQALHHKALPWPFLHPFGAEQRDISPLLKRGNVCPVKCLADKLSTSVNVRDVRYPASAKRSRPKPR